MLNLSMSEVLLFAIIALIVLGPDKLPQAVRFTGRWYGKLKRLVNNVQNDLDRELRLSELQQQMQQELIKIQQLEKKMQEQIEKNPLDETRNMMTKNQFSLTPHHVQHYQPCVFQKQKVPFVQSSQSYKIELESAV